MITIPASAERLSNASRSSLAQVSDGIAQLVYRKPRRPAHRHQPTVPFHQLRHHVRNLGSYFLGNIHQPVPVAMQEVAWNHLHTAHIYRTARINDPGVGVRNGHVPGEDLEAHLAKAGTSRTPPFVT